MIAESVRALVRLFLVAWLWPTGISQAAGLNIAAASDLKFALDELVTAFHAEHPVTRVTVTYGSSGNFYGQLVNRAPFDLFLSADIDYPRRLAEKGLALDSDVFHYAQGRIVLWTPHRTSLNIEQLGIQSLVEPAVRKIAIANPRHAPYGVAAVAAMKSLGVYEQVHRKLVYGENIAQTAQFVESGAADVGILARSLVLAPELRDAGRSWEIPSEAYPSIEQGGLILSWTKDAHAARVFRDFMLGKSGRAVLERFGFLLPER
jgi:molybdate transport system substrate-binding protein